MNSMASQPGQFGALVKIIDDFGETKSDLEIVLDLYHRLYPDSNDPRWKDPESYLTHDMVQIPGIGVTFPELKERVIGQYELEYRKYEKVCYERMENLVSIPLPVRLNCIAPY